MTGRRSKFHKGGLVLRRRVTPPLPQRSGSASKARSCWFARFVQRITKMRVLGVNAVFHNPAAALVVDGQIVAAAEEERFNRRKHGKPNVPFSGWEMPALSARWCLEYTGLRPQDVDAVAFSFDPSLCVPLETLGMDDP